MTAPATTVELYCAADGRAHPDQVDRLEAWHGLVAAGERGQVGDGHRRRAGRDHHVDGRALLGGDRLRRPARAAGCWLRMSPAPRVRL